MPKSFSGDRRDLIVATREQIEELLHARRVYDFDSYAWSPGGDGEPNLLGHAMWQTDPPLGWEFSLGMDEDSKQAQEYPLWLQFLAISGADFEGLMIASRLSIGLALFHRQMAEEHLFSADEFFQLHLLAATVTLGSASDRIRDVFVGAAFNKTADQYKAVGSDGNKGAARRRSEYVTPFVDALRDLGTTPGASAQLASSLQALPSLGDAVQKFRDARNEVVHEVATEIGRRERATLARHSKASSDTEEKIVDWRKLDSYVEVAWDNRRAQIAENLARPIAWYELLINMSNHVFIAHHYLSK